MRKLFSLIVTLFVYQLTYGQIDSTALLNIDGRNISKEEFLRIYNKNSNITAEEKKSVADYLELFVNYKLKVIEAENLGYDTAKSFITEMAGYRDQLAKPYFENNALIDSLVKQYYEWSKYEINASHILIETGKTSPPKDTLKAYQKVMALKARIDAGEPFEEIAKANSNDPSAKTNSGNLGWFSVFRMVVPFEAPCFTTPIGKVTGPVRTQYGYHLIKINDKRETRPELAVSHIMVLLPRNPTDLDIQTGKQKIDKAYAELEEGANWDDVVKKYSEHKATASRGGKLDWIKTGNVPDEFLEVCYTLDSGKYSAPFKSDYGYHIAKVDGHKPFPAFADVKDEYSKKLKTSGDIITMSEEQTLTKIKTEYGYKYQPENFSALFSLVDSTIYSGEWDAEKATGMSAPVWTIGSTPTTQYDLAKYISKKRIYNRNKPIESSLFEFVMEYSKQSLLDYEKNQLPTKYPDYGYLLEEYHDGILLFNLTEDKVWKKAIEDSVGLKTFYDQLPEKYMWKERIKISKFTYSDSTLTPTLLKQAKVHSKKGGSAEDISKVICPNDSLPCLVIKEQKYEKGENAMADSILWKKGSYLTTKEKDKFVLLYVDAILPEQTKKLEDARGLYTADYQTYLEKIWIESLRKKYTIIINQAVLQQVKADEATVSK